MQTLLQLHHCMMQSTEWAPRSPEFNQYVKRQSNRGLLSILKTKVFALFTTSLTHMVLSAILVCPHPTGTYRYRGICKCIYPINKSSIFMFGLDLILTTVPPVFHNSAVCSLPPGHICPACPGHHTMFASHLQYSWILSQLKLNEPMCMSICLFVYFSVSVLLYLCDKTIKKSVKKKSDIN